MSFVCGESVQDINGHGTHCAGIIAGPANSCSGIRYGVAPGVELLVAKVLGGWNGMGWEDDIVAGIAWASAQGARVISMSVQSPRRTMAPYNQRYETEAYNLRMKNPGTVMFAAAGNDSERPHFLAPISHPASCPSILAVAAVDENRSVYRHSCATVDPVDCVSLSAPGVQVLSAFKGGGFRALSGTSMAAPHAAGIAALHLELRPTMDTGTLWRILRESASPAGRVEDLGAGIVTAPV